jgi:serine/threonine protein kinase/tetratricopeptide (TPR) repeat protein
MQPAREEPDRETRIKHVFLDAAELEGSGREEYLARACGADVEFRLEVERLLAAFDDTRGLFGGPIPGAFFLDRSGRHTFAPGDRVGRFTIVDLLGIGGMGEVYEVAEAEFGGQFALKTLRREFALRGDLVARFKREIQLARLVTHPNVCRVYEVGFHETETEKSCYLTMELLRGQTLTDRLRQGRLDLPTAVGLIRQIVSGISALHAAGVVHRDIKPANVIIVPASASDRAVITDFGVAHPLSSVAEDELTVSGQLIGTLKYMAPDQLTGKKVGPEADVYSLGIVMYEVIRGLQTGIVGSWHQRVSSDIQESRHAGKSAEGEIERRLLEIILRCLEPDPKTRFTNAGEIQIWLGRLDEGVRHRPKDKRIGAWIPSEHQNRKPSRSFRQLAIPAGIVVVIGIATISWPITRTPALRAACRAFPGNSFACELPAERDIAILPFRILAASEEDSALASGYSQFLRGALSRLHPKPGEECLHLRNDKLSDGVRLVFEGEIRSERGAIDFSFTVTDTWAAKNSSALLRSVHVSLPTSSVERLYNEPLQLVASALKQEHHPAIWPGWTKRRPHDAHAFTSYLRALGHLEARRYQRAIDSAGETIDPAGEFAYAPAHLVLAQAYRLSSNGPEKAAFVTRARQAAERASALDPDLDFGLAERELGDLESALAHPEAAIPHYSAALRSWPFDEASVKGLAAALEATGRVSDAERTFQEAVFRAPRCWLARNSLADFYSRHSRYADAERTLLEAIRYTPRNAVLYHNLAFDYLKRGRYDDAVQMASKSIELNPVPIAYSTLGRAYLYKDCMDAAVLNLRHAVSLDPKYYILWANLAEALSRQDGNAQESRQAFMRVVEFSTQLLQRSPTHMRARLQRALNLARLGQTGEALVELDNLLRISRNEETFLAGAQVYELTGRRKDSLAILELALKAGLSIFQARAAANLELLRADPEYGSLLQRMRINVRGEAGSFHSAGARSCPATAVPGKGL